jgi:hypothetical protein
MFPSHVVAPFCWRGYAERFAGWNHESTILPLKEMGKVVARGLACEMAHRDFLKVSANV